MKKAYIYLQYFVRVLTSYVIIFSEKSEKITGNYFSSKNLWNFWENSRKNFRGNFVIHFFLGNFFMKRFPHIAQGSFLADLEGVIHSRFTQLFYMKYNQIQFSYYIEGSFISLLECLHKKYVYEIIFPNPKIVYSLPVRVLKCLRTTYSKNGIANQSCGIRQWHRGWAAKQKKMINHCWRTWNRTPEKWQTIVEHSSNPK